MRQETREELDIGSMRARTGPSWTGTALAIALACASLASPSAAVAAAGDDKPAKKPRALAPTYDPSKAPKPAPSPAPSSTPSSAPSTSPSTPAAPVPSTPATPAAKPSAPATAPASVGGSSGSAGKPAVAADSAKDARAASDDEPWQPRCEIQAGFVETRPSDSPPLETEEERAREQLGRLLLSRCDVVIDEAPMRDALRALRRAIGINLVVFELGGGMPGIDPDQPVSLRLENASGREVLEALAGMTGLSCTWQLHNATVEFGPKATLAREEARFPKLYNTGDLAMDPADWKSRGIGLTVSKSYNRRDSDEIIGELVRMITTHCEPEAFQPPPPMMVEDANGNLVIVKHTSPTGGRSFSPKSNPNTTATRNFDPSLAVVYATGQWASIQAKDNSIIVIGPDFVHRTIDGYAQPIPPRAATPDAARK